MNIVTLLPILLLFVLLYFAMIKPAKKRQQQAAETQNALKPGMEVRTIGGLFATVSEVEDDSVILEIAPGVHCRFIKGAIAAVLSTDEHTETHSDEPDHADDEDAAEPHAHEATEDAEQVSLDKAAEEPSKDA